MKVRRVQGAGRAEAKGRIEMSKIISAKGRQPLCGAAEGRPHDFAVHFYELLLLLSACTLNPSYLNSVHICSIIPWPFFYFISCSLPSFLISNKRFRIAGDFSRTKRGSEKGSNLGLFDF